MITNYKNELINTEKEFQAQYWAPGKLDMMGHSEFQLLHYTTIMLIPDSAEDLAAERGYMNSCSRHEYKLK